MSHLGDSGKSHTNTRTMTHGIPWVAIGTRQLISSLTSLMSVCQPCLKVTSNFMVFKRVRQTRRNNGSDKVWTVVQSHHSSTISGVGYLHSVRLSRGSYTPCLASGGKCPIKNVPNNTEPIPRITRPTITSLFLNAAAWTTEPIMTTMLATNIPLLRPNESAKGPATNDPTTFPRNISKSSF